MNEIDMAIRAYINQQNRLFVCKTLPEEWTNNFLPLVQLCLLLARP